MKRNLFFICVTILFLIFSLFGCSAVDEVKHEVLSIVTASFPLYDFASNIVGENGNVTLLLKPGEEIHSYEPTPQDIIAIRNSDLFLYIGGESDSWIEKIITPSINAVSFIDSVDIIENEHQHSEEHEYDEHIWTSPENAIKIVEKISDELIGADPDNIAYYEANSEQYISKLTRLDSDFKATVSNAVRKTVVVADRFPFLYLAKEYGIEYYSALSGCSDESEVSASVIAELVKVVKEENIPTVFYIEMSNGRIADTVCNETGAKKALLHSCSNVSREEYDRNETYISLMEKNLIEIRKALY